VHVHAIVHTTRAGVGVADVARGFQFLLGCGCGHADADADAVRAKGEAAGNSG
jgi:hypothetical protein